MERIEVKDIRKGDKIRLERDLKPGVEKSPTALEFTAPYDGYTYWPDTLERVYLLERPVTLPTEPGIYVVRPGNDDWIHQQRVFKLNHSGEWYDNADPSLGNEFIESMVRLGWDLVRQVPED